MSEKSSRRASVLALAVGCALSLASVPGTAQQAVFNQFQVVGAPGLLGAGEGSDVIGAPYSGVGRTETVRQLADGNRIVNITTVRYYRDSQGRVRTEHFAQLSGTNVSPNPDMITIVDPVAGQRYILHPQTKTATAMSMGDMAPGIVARQIVRGSAVASQGTAVAGQDTAPPPPPALLPAPAVVSSFTAMPLQGNVTLPASTPLGTRTINGVEAVGTRTEHVIPAGQIGNERPITITHEQWTSTELGLLVRSVHRDPMMGETIYELEDIVRSEPDPALFKVPADYQTQELNFPGERGFRVLPPPPPPG